MAISIRPTAAVGSNDGRLQLSAVGADGALYHLSQVTPSDGWSGWSSSGTPQGGAVISAPSMGQVNLIDKFGLNVYVVATDSSISFEVQVGADDPWGPPWSSLGPAFLAPPTKVIGFGLVNYLFAVGTDGTLRLQFDGPPPGWVAHPGPALIGTPTVAPSADGRLEVFAVGTDGALIHQWQVAPIAPQNWSGWFSHGVPPGTTLVGSPAIAASADGRLELFAVGADGALYHIWQTAVNDGWSGWFSHGTPP